MIVHATHDELNQLLDRTVHYLCSLGWKTAVVLARDEANGSLALAAAAPQPASVSVTPVLAASLEGWASDGVAYLASLTPEQRDTLGAWQPDSLLVAPIQDRLGRLGWLLASDPADGQCTTEQALQGIETLVAGLAAAMRGDRETDRLRRQLARQMISHQIAQKIVSSTLDLDRVLKLTLDQLEHIITYNSASIMLTEGPHLRITAVNGFEHPETLVGQLMRAEENNLAHQTLRSQQVRVVTDVQQTTEWGHERDDLEGTTTIRSWIGVPLVVRGQGIGMLGIDAYEPGAYDESDGEAVAAFGAQIASAIHNARLYDSELRRRQTAAALVRLSQIVNSTLNQDEVLQSALEQLSQVVSFDTASILLLEGSNLVVTACQGFKDPLALLGSVITPGEVNTAYMALTQQRTRVIADVRTNGDWGHMRDYLDEIQAIRSWIGAPLIVRDQGIGVLTVDKRTPHFYSEEDGEMVSAFAAQIAMAIHNAWLYQAAQRQRDRLATILNDARDAIIVLDEQGLVWLPNPASERYLCIRTEQVLGQPVSALGLPELNEAFGQAQENMEPVNTEVTGPDGRIFHASLTPVRDVGWVILMQDITSLKELDRLRTDWVTTVSHDLKNPIQIIQLAAAMLDLDAPLASEQHERVELILDSAMQLNDLVTGVLDLARLEAGPLLRLVPVDARAIIVAVLAEIDNLAEKKSQMVAADVPEGLPLIQGDSALLKRALSNLLANAVKYTPPGGRIEVSARVAGDQMEIAVSDNGPGISPEAQARIFERFYRVPDSIAGGTGLGLSIVRSIMDKLNGRIRVTSTPGEGSMFVMSLPLAAPGDWH